MAVDTVLIGYVELFVSEAITEFVGLATESLEKLMSVFQRAPSLMTTNADAKAAQFLEVSHKSQQLMMPLVSSAFQHPFRALSCKEARSLDFVFEAPLALPQPVWQAGEPIRVNVDFDGPSNRTLLFASVLLHLLFFRYGSSDTWSPRRV